MFGWRVRWRFTCSKAVMPLALVHKPTRDCEPSAAKQGVGKYSFSSTLEDCGFLHMQLLYLSKVDSVASPAVLFSHDKCHTTHR